MADWEFNPDRPNRHRFLNVLYTIAVFVICVIVSWYFISKTWRPMPEAVYSAPILGTSPSTTGSYDPGPLREVPDVTGLDARTALHRMNIAGFKHVVLLSKTDGKPLVEQPAVWVVTGQSHKPGSLVRADDFVTLDCRWNTTD